MIDKIKSWCPVFFILVWIIAMSISQGYIDRKIERLKERVEVLETRIELIEWDKK